MLVKEITTRNARYVRGEIESLLEKVRDREHAREGDI